MLPMIVLSFTVIVLVIIDQVVKYFCFNNLVEPITLIPGFIELSYLENRGAAFGIMQDKSFFLVVFPIIIIIGLIVFYTKLGNSRNEKISKASLILILSGAIGNLIDRVFNGFVVDMFHFTFFDFPIFNIADIYVVVGTILLMIVTLLSKEEK